MVRRDGSRPSASVRRRSSSRLTASSEGRSGTAGFAPTGCQPSPRRATRRRATWLWPPTQIGGGGAFPRGGGGGPGGGGGGEAAGGGGGAPPPPRLSR